MTQHRFTVDITLEERSDGSYAMTLEEPKLDATIGNFISNGAAASRACERLAQWFSAQPKQIILHDDIESARYFRMEFNRIVAERDRGALDESAFRRAGVDLVREVDSAARRIQPTDAKSFMARNQLDRLKLDIGETIFGISRQEMKPVSAEPERETPAPRYGTPRFERGVENF